MSAFGTSRHFAATQDACRFRSETDMIQQARWSHRSRMTLSGHFFTGPAKVSSPDHLVKNRLISSENRAAAGSCFKKR
jgi:hypothetical protein